MRAARRAGRYIDVHRDADAAHERQQRDQQRDTVEIDQLVVVSVEDEAAEGESGDPAAELERLQPGNPTSTAATAATSASQSGRRNPGSTSATRSCWKPRRRVTAPLRTVTSTRPASSAPAVAATTTTTVMTLRSRR